jgi:hypothetical protein
MTAKERPAGGASGPKGRRFQSSASSLSQIASPAQALVIEREVTNDLDRQPWPPTGLGDGWHLVRSYPDCKQTLWRRIQLAHAPKSPGARDPVR